MPARTILQYGHPSLHAPARAVESFDDRLITLLSDMRQTLYAAPGIGLAAPQIGVALRVIIVDLSVGADPAQLIQLVNPRLVETAGRQRHAEGCLSVPGFEGSPCRPARVVVAGFDAAGEPRRYTATGLLARAFCHEVDHVDGLLFVDRLAPLKREWMRRRLRRRFGRAS
jgi:peptide deformylase